MLAIVISLADEASMAIGEQLRAIEDWERRHDERLPDAEGGGTVDRTDGRVRIDVVVHTGSGSVSTTAVAVPWGRLTARNPADTEDAVSARLPDSGPVADRIGAWLR